MEYRKLGRSGLWVSEITFGNLVTGSVGDPEQAVACVRAAYEEGVTTFQAVAGDGVAMDVLAKGIAGLPRDDLVLCGGVAWSTGSGPGAGGLSRKQLSAAVHASLRRLDTDHLDLLTLPRFDHDTPLEETFCALSDLVRQGAVHYVGLSEWGAEHIASAAAVAAAHHVPLVAEQAHYSMLWRVPEAQVMPAAERAGLGHLAYAPLAQGLLTGKYCIGEVPAGSRATVPGAAGDIVRLMLHPELLGRVELLVGVAEPAGLTPAQLAVAWVLQNRSVATAVVGASSPEQVRENCAASGKVLDLDTLTRVELLLGAAVQTDPRMVVPAPQP